MQLTPLPDLVGQRRAPWQDKTRIDLAPSDAAASVIARYDRDADGSRFSGYTPPEHVATVRTTSSIADLLAAAARVQHVAGPVRRSSLETVFAGYDTNRDGRLTWDDANGGTRMPEFFGDLTRVVGEEIVRAERSIS